MAMKIHSYGSTNFQLYEAVLDVLYCRNQLEAKRTLAEGVELRSRRLSVVDENDDPLETHLNEKTAELARY